MKMNDFLDQAWSEHANEPKKVLEDIKQNLALIETETDILSLAHLIVHVSGIHLGDWLSGLELLKKLKNNSLLKDKTDMNRYVAILELGNNSATPIDKFSLSDQARILASTASALASLGGLKVAENYMVRAEEIAALLPKEDMANKSLAIAGNSIASSLEEKTELKEKEVSLMLKAAKVGRKFWEIAGTWKEVERAEYRLAHSYLKAGLLDEALAHANTCLKIVEQNNNEVLEVFMGYEALALVLKEKKESSGFMKAVEQMATAFKNLTPNDQSWCQAKLDKVQA